MDEHVLGRGDYADDIAMDSPCYLPRTDARTGTTTESTLRSTIPRLARDAWTSTSDGLSTAASTVKSYVGSAGTKVSEAGRYVKEEGWPRLDDEFKSVVRKNPFVAVGVGFGIGLLLGTAMKQSER